MREAHTAAMKMAGGFSRKGFPSLNPPMFISAVKKDFSCEEKEQGMDLLQECW